MSRVCEHCGKKPSSGNMVSHSNRRTRRRWLPNLQKVVLEAPDGSPISMKLCTRCVRNAKHGRLYL